jgi:hypothetical protein
MKRVNQDMEDELRAEYDLKSLRVRKLGPGRNIFCGTTVRLEPDVAEMFPTADAVNEALRFMIRILQQNPPPALKTQPDPALDPTEPK